jgi:hypothetical protein
MKTATELAQQIADQELEAVTALAKEKGIYWFVDGALRSRRPKPPSLKEQSLALIDLIQGKEKAWDIRDLDTIRRALEQLND